MVSVPRILSALKMTSLWTFASSMLPREWVGWFEMALRPYLAIERLRPGSMGFGKIITTYSIFSRTSCQMWRLTIS